jgi:hypothetical protein
MVYRFARNRRESALITLKKGVTTMDDITPHEVWHDEHTPRNPLREIAPPDTARGLLS